MVAASFQFSSDGRINIVPSWSCCFGLFPPSLSWQQRALHRPPCRSYMSHTCLSPAHVFQARHNVCYQQDIVSFWGSSLKFLILSQFQSLELSDILKCFWLLRWEPLMIFPAHDSHFIVSVNIIENKWLAAIRVDLITLTLYLMV